MATTSTDRLLRRTRRRLFLTTLALLTLLVVGVGAATVVVATSSLDADLDRALEAAVLAQVTALDGEMPDGEEQQEAGEHSPAIADTVLLVLDADGRVLLNRTGQTLPGLPDAEALKGAADGLDIRTVETDGTEVRVLTMLVMHDGIPAGYIQGGFDLTLHDQQSRSLVLAVLVVGALGLVAAAAIAYVVTGRALVPIREGFEAQRRFVADASHELRTPAALIRANAEVLERERLVADDGRDLLDDVIAEADRLGGLVGDLLQLAGWDATSLTIAPEPLDVAAIARDTVRGATALAAERGVGLVVDAPGPAPHRRTGTASSSSCSCSSTTPSTTRPPAARSTSGSGGTATRSSSRLTTRGPASRSPTGSGSSSPSPGCRVPRAMARAARAWACRSRAGSRRRTAGRSRPERRPPAGRGSRCHSPPARRTGRRTSPPATDRDRSPAATPGRSGPRCRRPRLRGRARAGHR